MNHTLKVSVLFLVLITTVISCEKDDLNGDVVTDSQLREKLYLNAKDTIRIDNQNLVLEADLSRNFFPGGPIKKSSRLSAYLILVNIDSLQISFQIKIKTLYVINNDQIWVSTPKINDYDVPPIYQLRRVSVDGPEWETGTYVDVVLLVEDLSTGTESYLIERNIEIRREE
jgi:hypothetical protein